MRKRFAILAVAALALTGCALKMSTGGGDPARLSTDLQLCAKETLAFAFIPDGGSTAEYHRAKCMKERGWIWDLGSGFNDWAWAGPGSSRQLVRFKNGDVAVQVICPRGLTCQSVVPSTEPTEWTAWAYEAWGDSQFRRVELAIVGDEARCEEVRLRDSSKGVPTGPCRGPVYFKREGAPDAPRIAAPIASAPAISVTTTWATGE